MKRILIFILVLSGFSVLAQEDTAVSAFRTEEKIHIDGELDEKVWSKADCIKGFTTYEPSFGKKPSQKTEVCVAYNDKAIYIGARMYDSEPDKILKEITKRDYDNGNTDMFTIQLNPNNDGRNMYVFKLTASNVQTDIRVSDGSYDYDWDAVWDSEVVINKEGWFAEIKIPYSALRFPDKDEQHWSVNFWRKLRRNREMSSWHPVRKEKGPQAEQMGELYDLDNINPPLRLSFYPYLSGNIDFYGNVKKPVYGLSGGLDMKLGLSKSHTLDMTLIPDFSQVKSDEEQLNLSPFETYYSENRPFFTEGTELFEKVGLFYSRRIGKIPDKYYDIRDSADSGYEILQNPRYSRLINAVKLTGRGENNLAVGVLNAVTANTYAEIEDSLENVESVLTEPWANYNMLVLDQSFENNSYFNFTNARVDRPDADFHSNVAGMAFRFMEKTNRFGVYGDAAWSNIQDSITSNDSITNGYKINFGIGKLNGNWEYDYSLDVKSDGYNPNAFGFLRRNNSIEHRADLSYHIYEPFWVLNNLTNRINLSYKTSYKDFLYKESRIWINSYTETQNYTSIWNDLVIRLGETHDYYEAREPGRVYKYKETHSENFYISTDYRKTFALDFKSGVFSDLDERYGFYGMVSPRVRLSDKLNLDAGLEYNLHFNDVGYVARDNEEIVFGIRDLETYVSSMEFNWVFSNKMYMSVDLRHYWRKVDYKDFSYLCEDGYLSESITYTDDEDINFNTFNLDLLYSWNFAPGSYLSFMWKNQIYESEKIPESQTFPGYGKNLNNMFQQSQLNSFSLRVLYYLDWQYFS